MLYTTLLHKAVIAFVLLSGGSCQQLKEIPKPYEVLGLSDGCFAAVNSTLRTCSGMLRLLAR